MKFVVVCVVSGCDMSCGTFLLYFLMRYAAGDSTEQMAVEPVIVIQ